MSAELNRWISEKRGEWSPSAPCGNCGHFHMAYPDGSVKCSRSYCECPKPVLTPLDWSGNWSHAGKLLEELSRLSEVRTGRKMGMFYVVAKSLIRREEIVEEATELETAIALAWARMNGYEQ